jgi:hypothetical protein
MTHYVENVGEDDVIFIEVLQADHFSGMSFLNSRPPPLLKSFEGIRNKKLLTQKIDISVGQWLGLVPPQITMDTLNLTNETVSTFKKEKQYIVQGAVVT